MAKQPHYTPADIAAAGEVNQAIDQIYREFTDWVRLADKAREMVRRIQPPPIAANAKQFEAIQLKFTSDFQQGRRSSRAHPAEGYAPPAMTRNYERLLAEAPMQHAALAADTREVVSRMAKLKGDLGFAEGVLFSWRNFSHTVFPRSRPVSGVQRSLRRAMNPDVAEALHIVQSYAKDVAEFSALVGQFTAVVGKAHEMARDFEREIKWIKNFKRSGPHGNEQRFLAEAHLLKMVQELNSQFEQWNMRFVSVDSEPLGFEAKIRELERLIGLRPKTLPKLPNMEINRTNHTPQQMRDFEGDVAGEITKREQMIRTKLSAARKELSRRLALIRRADRVIRSAQSIA